MPNIKPSPVNPQSYQSRRRFSKRERTALYLAAGGHCAACGIALPPGWHADHGLAFSKGGLTDVANGQALCPTCNLRKGSNVVEDKFVDRTLVPGF